MKKLCKPCSRLWKKSIVLSRTFKNYAEGLKAKTTEFKGRLAKGETLDDLLPEAYAAVREAARRILNQRHFDVQLIGGIVLHRGQISEMKTGEGKTLVATLPLYLKCLNRKRRPSDNG